jgi:acyl-coenzyme A thioesterase 9
MFGGFLMKCAFELAFATAYTSGGCRPLFKEVDEIAFLQPVGE